MSAKGGADTAPPTEQNGTAAPGRARPGFRPDVQGLRTIAIVLVVVFHSGIGLSGGFLGVDVFFVISGFVIGRLLLFEQAETGRIALGRFYARRVRRLLPALAAVLVFVAVSSTFALSPLGTLRDTTVKVGVGAAVYVANFALLGFQHTGYFDLDATTNPLLHTWTLAVEEQFYVFFPLLLLAGARLGRRSRGPSRRTLFVVVGVAALASFVAGAILSGSFSTQVGPFGARARLAFYSSPTRAWEFLAGVLVAFAEPTAQRLKLRSARIAGLVGAAAILAAAWFVTGIDATPGVTTLVPVVGTALVILAGTAHRGGLTRLLSTRPAVWIGDRSYGWYLWHWPLIVLVRMSFPTASTWVLLVVGILALIPTEISYRFLEAPIRRNPRWVGRRAIGLAVVCSGAAVVLLIGLGLFPKFSSKGTVRAAAALTPAPNMPTSCMIGRHDNDPKREIHCTWSVPYPRGKIVLVGDSLAGAIGGSIATQSNRAGYSLSMAYRPGCPFADVDRVYGSPSLDAACRQFVQRTMTTIKLTKPDLVVLVARQASYVHLGEFTLRNPVSGITSSAESTKARIWRGGLTRTLGALSLHKIPAVVVATVPQLAPFNLELCPAWRLWAEPASCARTLSRRQVAQYRRAGLTATRQAVHLVPGTRLVDFIDDLCTPQSCSTYRNGVWMYQDSTHLSSLGAATLGPAIAREVLPVAR